MPTPLHVAAFEKFNKEIPDHLEATVAFGLFLVSEREWAGGQNTAPTVGDFETFHQHYLTPHEIWRLHQDALGLLAKFGTRLVQAKRVEFLEDAIKQYRLSAAAGHRQFRGRGVLEAILGAAAWTIVLVVVSILLAWGGIDILEYYKRTLPPEHQHAATTDQ
jgi:hypothetical protein